MPPPGAPAGRGPERKPPGAPAPPAGRAPRGGVTGPRPPAPGGGGIGRPVRDNGGPGGGGIGRPEEDVGGGPAGRRDAGGGVRGARAAAGRWGTSVGPVCAGACGVSRCEAFSPGASAGGRVGRWRSVLRDEITRPGIGAGAGARVASLGSGSGLSDSAETVGEVSTAVARGSSARVVMSTSGVGDSACTGAGSGSGAGASAGTSTAGGSAGSTLAAPFFAAAFLTGLAGSSGCWSRTSPSRSALRRTRSAWASMMLDEWVLTPMPRSRHRSRHSLLVSPSSLASSWTRSFAAKLW